MKLIALSDTFYKKYKDCSEILKKHSRPYFCVIVKEHGHTFAIPLRHHINHPFSYLTVGECGLDFSKAVIVDDPSYISDADVWIQTAEWNILRKNENDIYYQFRKYLRQYLRATAHPDNPRNKLILQYSTLSYFDF